MPIPPTRRSCTALADHCYGKAKRSRSNYEQEEVVPLSPPQRPEDHQSVNTSDGESLSIMNEKKHITNNNFGRAAQKMGKFTMLVTSLNDNWVCKICNAKIQKPKDKSTAGILYHFNSKHKLNDPEKYKAAIENLKNCDTNQPKIEESFNKWADGSDKNIALDRALSQMIATCSLSLSFSEQPGFLNFVKHLSTNYKPKSRKFFAKKGIPMLYQEYLDKLKCELLNARYLAIGFDLWADESNVQEGIGIVVYFDKNGVATHRFLSFIDMKKLRHTGFNISEKIKEVLSNFGISTKVTMFLRDGAANVISATNMMGYDSFDCFNHKIHLCAKDGCDSIVGVSQVIGKYKKIVRKYKKSPSTLSEFEDILEKESLPLVRLKKSCEVRWNYVYEMLTRATQCKTALSILLSNHPELPNLKEEDFLLMEKTCDLLRPLWKITKQAEARGTSVSIVIPVCKIMIEELSKRTDMKVAALAICERLKKVLVEYEKCDSMVISTLTDPRFKGVFSGDNSLDLLKNALSLIEVDVSNENIDDVVEIDGEQKEGEEEDFFSKYIKRAKYEVTVKDTDVSIEMEAKSWLNEPCSGTSVEEFWNHNSTKFPRIFSLSRRYHFIPPSTSEESNTGQEEVGQFEIPKIFKDLEFWLTEIECPLQSEDCGKTWASVKVQLERMSILKADIVAHLDHVNEMNDQADLLLDNEQFQGQQIDERRKLINERYDNVKKMAAVRREKLNTLMKVHEFFSDVENEETWIREKKVLISSDRDLRCRKHRPIDNELARHTHQIFILKLRGEDMLRSGQTGLESLIKKSIDELEESWSQFEKSLNQSEKFQELLGKVEEAEAWMNEKQPIIESDNFGENINGVQELLKKHYIFQTDLEVCNLRINGLVNLSEEMIGNGTHYCTQFAIKCEQLRSRLQIIEEVAEKRLSKLRENSEYLQFMWKCDVVESWIAEKKQEIDSQDYGKDIASVKILLAKQEAFDAGVNSFVNEGIERIRKLTAQMRIAQPHKLPAINIRQSNVIQRWNQLAALSVTRKEQLVQMQERLEEIEDLKSELVENDSHLNSWYEMFKHYSSDLTRTNSFEETRTLREAHEKFKMSLLSAQETFVQMQEAHNQVVGSSSASIGELELNMSNLQQCMKKREEELQPEILDLEKNRQLRSDLTNLAHTFHVWLKDTRARIVELAGSLAEQLNQLDEIIEKIRTKKGDLERIKDIIGMIENDGSYAQQWKQDIEESWEMIGDLADQRKECIELHMATND